MRLTPPFDSTEIRVKEIIVSQAHGPYRLMPIGNARIVRIPLGIHILNSNGMWAKDAQGTRSVHAGDAFLSVFCGAQITHIVFACRRVEHEYVANDEAQRQEPLRGRAVMVVAFP